MSTAKQLQEKYDFARVVAPIGGIVESVVTLSTPDYEPVFSLRSASLGDIAQLWPEVGAVRGTLDDRLGGTGTDTDPELAWVKAVVEALERYASVTLLEKEYIWATPRELGNSALDLDSLPTASQRELQDPKCWVRPPDDNASIRWVKGLSLSDNSERYIPVSLSHIVPRKTAAEEFSIQISTGIAAHTDLQEAILTAILEVIERDAIALTWLGRLPLRRIAFEPEADERLRDMMHRVSKAKVQIRLYDATTDLGVPIVYSLQLVDGHPTVAQTVSCAAGFNPYQLAEKVIRESVACRLLLAADEKAAPAPSNVRDFYRLTDGAQYMGSPQRRSAFDFLLRQEPTMSLADCCAENVLPETRLAWLRERLNQRAMDVYLVDLSTDEARDVGVWVIRAIIPRLMPMTTVYRARFLGTPRLYDYVRSQGFRSFSEDDVNPMPQPFS